MFDQQHWCYYDYKYWNNCCIYHHVLYDAGVCRIKWEIQAVWSVITLPLSSIRYVNGRATLKAQRKAQNLWAVAFSKNCDFRGCFINQSLLDVIKQISKRLAIPEAYWKWTKANFLNPSQNIQPFSNIEPIRKKIQIATKRSETAMCSIQTTMNLWSLKALHRTDDIRMTVSPNTQEIKIRTSQVPQMNLSGSLLIPYKVRLE